MPDPLEDMIEAAAAALHIPLDPQWKSEVRTQLQVILHHGASVAQFSLPDDAEPAPMFKA